jgi:hypothetical protein
MKHERNDRKRMCVGCGVRPARYRYHGQVKADRSHVLCFQCYRAVRDSQRLAQPRTFALRGRSTNPDADPSARGRTGTNDR